jgi:lipopolysaccharide transport system ATP-binding protein
MTETVVALKNLGKMYKLYRRPVDRVLDVFGINRCLFWRKPNYREFWALRGVNLEVARGERLGIIGHNGAGKSTLLKLVTGNLTPTEGTVHVGGRVQVLMELGTGFHPEFTGRQNIAAALTYQGVTGAEIATREEEIVDFAELDQFIDQPVKTYSAGMYARLAFATATSMEPDILIIDEILGAGDAYFTGKCVERMCRLTERAQTTVLFVSHDVGSIQRLCSRLIWMEHGQIRRMGRPSEMIGDYLELMRQQNELRQRARERKRQARNTGVVIDEMELHQAFRFRLCPAARGPQGRHLVYRLSLLLDDRPLTTIEVGGPMDNSGAHPSRLIDEVMPSGWSSPRLSGDRWARALVAGSPGVYADFVLAVPPHLIEGKPHLQLEIEHQPATEAPVAVEYLRPDGWQALGTLTADGPAAVQASVFSIGLGGAPAAPVPAAPASAEDKLCVIRGIDFLRDDGSNVRTVPVKSRLRIQVHFEALRPIYNPVFAVTINNTDGTQMDHQNTKLLGIEVGWVHGKATYCFAFNPLRIGVGDYLVTPAIFKCLDLARWDDIPPCYDRHDRRYCLTVFTASALGKNLGLVVQESTFQLLRDEVRQAG